MALVALSDEQSEAFRKLIEEWSGISVDDNRSNVLSFRLHPLLSKFGCADYWDLINQIRSTPQRFKDTIIDAVTTNETSWFRDGGIYDELRSSILPELLEKRGSAGLDIWSAACSTGQEPYTLATVLCELTRSGAVAGSGPMASRILATDISPAALAAAEKGQYDPVSMKRGFPLEMLQQYFEQRGALCTVSTRLKRMVHFKRTNLVQDDFGQNRMDLILIRNVLIYFTEETKTKILEKVHRALRPDGLMILGASENAQRFTTVFKPVFAGGVMYYSKR